MEACSVDNWRIPGFAEIAGNTKMAHHKQNEHMGEILDDEPKDIETTSLGFQAVAKRRDSFQMYGKTASKQLVIQGMQNVNKSTSTL